MSSQDRMLTILDLFQDDTSVITLEAVIAHLECSRATAYRYLKSLADSGLLSPTAGGAYVLGSRIIELDRHLQKHDPLMRAAKDVMQRTGDALKTNLMLCSYYGKKVMCVDRYWPDTTIESSYARGRPFSMFAGATAKPILANLSTYQLRNLILWHADEIQAAGLGSNWDEFRSELKRLRQAGVYVSYGEVDADLVGIGSAIFNPEHKVIGSLVFILAQKRATARLVKQLQEEVGRAAAEISAQLEASAQPSTLPSRPPRAKTSRIA